MEAGLPDTSRDLGGGGLQDIGVDRVGAGPVEWVRLPDGDKASRWGQGFLGAQLASSKAPLQRDAFRIQFLGEQMHSLQRVPTALGVQECATCWDFDWERKR